MKAAISAHYNQNILPESVVKVVSVCCDIKLPQQLKLNKLEKCHFLHVFSQRIQVKSSS